MPLIPTKTPLQVHLEEWKDCTRCFLHSTRRQVVTFRGKVPCDVLCIGEAPGKGEDTCGVPFWGDAGDLLDTIIADAITGLVWCPFCYRQGKRTLVTKSVNGWKGVSCIHIGMDGLEHRPVFAFTNVIGCIPLIEAEPWEEDKIVIRGLKMAEPPEESIIACRTRVEQFVKIAKPRLIVNIGKVAETWLDQVCPMPEGIEVDTTIPQISIVHPAALLRMDYARKKIGQQRNSVNIRNAIIERVK